MTYKILYSCWHVEHKIAVTYLENEDIEKKTIYENCFVSSKKVYEETFWKEKKKKQLFQAYVVGLNFKITNLQRGKINLKHLLPLQS